MAQYNYIGKGSIYIGQSGSLVPVGNCSALQLGIEEEKKTLSDFENAGGGTVETVSRITGATLSMTLHNISPGNLAIGLRGETTATAGATVTDEAHANVFVGSLVLLDRIPNPSAALTATHGVTASWAQSTAYSLGDKILDTGHVYVVTVAGTSGGSEPTWPTNGSTVVDGGVTWDDLGVVALTENVDYTRVRAGIIAKAGGKLADGDTVKVSYTAVADNLVQALIESGQEFRLVFDGLNEAKSGKSVVVDVFKFKPNPTASLDLIGDDFGELVIEGDIIKDETKSGAGISQYFTVRLAAL